MKTFVRHRNIRELRRKCRDRGFYFNDWNYKAGNDTISFCPVLDGKNITVYYNTFNGRFWGEVWITDLIPQKFTSDDASLDGEKWFSELLKFVYVSKERLAA